MKSIIKKAALAALSSIVSKTLSEIKGLSISVLSPSHYQDYPAYKSAMEERIRLVTDSHRKKVFETICSDNLCRKYPVMKKIIKLPCSDMTKCIIFLAGIGCTTTEISNILMSEKHSISTMRSKCRNYIADIFKH